LTSSIASVGLSSGISRIEESLPDGIHGGISSPSNFILSPFNPSYGYLDVK